MTKSDLDAIENRLKLFFQQFSKREINLTTSINNDLQLLVSELSLIIPFFKKEFGIELKKEDLEPYFLDEFNIPFQYMYYKLFRPEKLKRHPVTIRHLIEVCQRGSWFAPS